MAAKFIELPYGEYNNETKKTDRAAMLVNLDQVITIKQYGEFACTVFLKGGSKPVVYRRYDTLRAQITNRQDLMETYPDEEVSAAYESGYKKGRAETAKNETRQAIIKEAIKAATMWFENNPMCNGWQGKFRRDLTQQLMTALEEVPEQDPAQPDDTDTF